MYKVIHGKTWGLKDVDDFIDIINTLDKQSIIQARSLFKREEEIIISRAPGRLDVMGGIADYSGSLVLQLPIKEATLSAVQLTSGRSIRIISLSANESGRQNYFEMPLGDFFDGGSAISYKSAKRYFKKNKPTQWAAYVAGAILVLIIEKDVRFAQGANILIYSNVPECKGVSSSAALQVAVMNAIIKAFGFAVQPHELASLCQKVENLVAGAPCGIMDQMTAVFGRENQLLALLCQLAELKPFIPIPEGISFWGIDSGIEHSVAGSDYTSVRVGAFMGQRIISELMDRHFSESYPSIQSQYLANITPSLYEKYFAAHIPEQMKGSEFIRRYHNTIDEVTEIDPRFVYNIRKPTVHPIYEHSRVGTFAELLTTPLTEDSCVKAGELMYQSHRSYSDCGLGTAGTDWLVALTGEFGPSKGLYGARITGGGSGGTVAVLGRREARHSVEKIAIKYSNETGYKPYLFSGSSMGALAFGCLILKGI